MISQKELEVIGGTEMNLYRWSPKDGRKGGYAVWARSAEIEHLFSQNRTAGPFEHPQDVYTQFYEAPDLYKERAGVDPFSFGWETAGIAAPDGNYYAPSFKLSPYLINRNECSVNMAFLRAKGLSKGVLFKIEVPPSEEDMKIYKFVVTQFIQRIHDAYFKKIRLNVSVPLTPEQRAQVR